MNIHRWELGYTLVRQPIMGTGKCIVRRVTGSLRLRERPFAGDNLLVRIHPLAEPFRIQVHSVALNTVLDNESSKDPFSGVITTKKMVLLPTNELPENPDDEFFKALDAIGSRRAPVAAHEIEPIDCKQWLLDGCPMDTDPQEAWFDGMSDGEGYSIEFMLTKEGKLQYQRARDLFAEAQLSAKY